MFIATTSACANEVFNATNGDVFRWNHLWPRIADFFRLPPGTARPLKLADVMTDKGPVWQRIVEKHALKQQPLTLSQLPRHGQY